VTQAWGSQPAWRVLDTAFGRALEFLRTWQAWKVDPLRPRMLHYVALSCASVSVDDLLAAAAPFEELVALAQELTDQWFDESAGFHRLTFEQGHVLLTVCVGGPTAVLREQQFVADAVFMDLDPLLAGVASTWDIWTIKALARCCRRGTAITLTPQAFHLRANLVQCGFEIAVAESETGLTTPARPTGGVFNPRWTIKSTRDPMSEMSSEPGTCVVVGAGLAGASVAASLARRGWQVQVLDQGDDPAAGASGLPVGLVVPHVSADDCALSRLSRAGVNLMLKQTQELLIKGQDWSDSGTLERRADGSPDPCEIWHQRAAWLKPRQMVRAWLALPGISFLGNTQVCALQQCDGGWLLLDKLNAVVARAERVVFANASAALPLIHQIHNAQPKLGIAINQIPAMHGVRGQLSWATHQTETLQAFPPFPMNGSGSVISSVPADQGLAWYVGSSYQPENKAENTERQNHAGNLARLSKLLPALAHALAPQFEVGAVNGWAGVRCVTADRLPAVGPLDSRGRAGLWICAGMGSRGLTFSALCAELLAATWAREPLPIGSSLASALYALRRTRGSGERLDAVD
jgi:tRNA 5-methylaminomethyl-2-thiouridine biosynthesis bifunctional protein